MWTFRISTGAVLGNGQKVGQGYSGYGADANNPKAVAIKMRGPIPPGHYTIGAAYKHPKLGPICMNLEPAFENEMFGRSLFRIHGDNSTPDPHDGSHGCIVLARHIREAISKSTDRALEVVE